MWTFCSIYQQKVTVMVIGKYLDCVKKKIQAFGSNLVKGKFLSVTKAQHK